MQQVCSRTLGHDYEFRTATVAATTAVLQTFVQNNLVPEINKPLYTIITQYHCTVFFIYGRPKRLPSFVFTSHHHHHQFIKTTRQTHVLT